MIRVLLVLFFGAVVVVAISACIAMSIDRQIRYERAHDAWRRDREEA